MDAVEYCDKLFENIKTEVAFEKKENPWPSMCGCLKGYMRMMLIELNAKHPEAYEMIKNKYKVQKEVL